MQNFPLSSSPLQLEHYYIQALRFETKAEFDRDNMDSAPAPDELQWNLEHHQSETGARSFRLTLRLPPENQRFAYAFEIIVVGLFRVDENFAGDADMMADANAPAVLFGAAREAIASVTGRGAFAALCLPTVHFLDIERQNAANQNTEAEEAPASAEASPKVSPAVVKGKPSKRSPSKRITAP